MQTRVQADIDVEYQGTEGWHDAVEFETSDQKNKLPEVEIRTWKLDYLLRIVLWKSF